MATCRAWERGKYRVCVCVYIQQKLWFFRDHQQLFLRLTLGDFWLNLTFFLAALKNLQLSEYCNHQIAERQNSGISGRLPFRKIENSSIGTVCLSRPLTSRPADQPTSLPYTIFWAGQMILRRTCSEQHIYTHSHMTDMRFQISFLEWKKNRNWWVGFLQMWHSEFANLPNHFS